MMDKPKKAAALSYNKENNAAPKLTAKGAGKTAENILETARQHNIPIQKDPSLAELLGKLEINTMIPEELYQAVAEVFAFVYQLDRQEDSRNMGKES